MATSPNYGWLEPDNTDLVKNGALAIRTLGNAIDTTMATMVPKSIVDAKGDLIAGTAADTAARLAVGNNGETLVADSSTSTGLRYTAGNPIPNPIINSAFQVWQRGTTFAISNTNSFTADRWVGLVTTAATTSFSRQTTNDTTNLPNIQYCMRVQRANGQTATPLFALEQSFETVNSIPYAGKTVTYSFYARAGANYSSASNALRVYVYTGTGTDQSIRSGYTGVASPIDATATLTTTWQRFTYTGTIAATATEIALQFQYTATGTAGAADYFEVTGVQIDIGSVALPFRTNQPTIATELAACQRYYVRFGTGGNTYEQIGFGMASDVTYVIAQMPLPVSMRVTPSAIDFSTLRVVDTQNASTVSSVTFDNANRPSTLRPILKFTTSGSLTQYRPYFIEVNNSTSGYLGLSAEL